MRDAAESVVGHLLEAADEWGLPMHRTLRFPSPAEMEMLRGVEIER